MKFQSHHTDLNINKTFIMTMYEHDPILKPNTTLALKNAAEQVRRLVIELKLISDEWPA